jgi:RHS repeat-associated protein
VHTSTDANGLVTTLSYDYLRRPTQVSQPNGPTVSFTYDDVHFTATSTSSIDSSKSIQQVTALDTLGRPYVTTTEDANNNIYSKVSVGYDLASRAYRTSNPYTGANPSYWTTTAFDVLGRPTSVTSPDNSVASLTYATNTTTASDPSGVQRKSAIDGAGRISRVWEPDPANNNSLTLQTSYSYNVLGEVTQITEDSQTRTFVYDAVSRLLSSTTPEAGRVCFGSVTGSTCNPDGYDGFNNLTKRTDARGVLTSYSYDTLNRLTGIAYTTTGTTAQATPSITLTYGNDSSCTSAHGAGCIGQIITLTDGVGSENYTYNNLERLTQFQKVIGTITYTTSYAYNLTGELTQITYPSGRVVQQSVDAIGRLCEIAPSTTGCGTASSPYATGYGYNAAGLPTGFRYGNGLYASLGFSPDRLQLNCLDYSTTNRNGSCSHDGTTKFGISYSFPGAPANNGLISGITDSVDNGRSATYTYDSLYRLIRAVTTGSSGYPAWGLSETYDRYGNRFAQSVYSGCVAPMTCPTNSVTPDAATNRITGSPYLYDLGGNMTNDGSNTLVYDAENHAVSTTNGGGSGTHTYDGNGLRVKKVSGSTTTVYIRSGSKVIAEYDNGAAPSSPSREYIYSGAALLAKIDSSGTKYYHEDHLSNRLVTDSSGNTLAQMGTFPYGESWYNASNDKLVFTTFERDSESGNDYAQARHNISRLARFSSPDPISGSASDPQSLNRYSYVRNMPVLLTDPTGLMVGCNTVDNRALDQQQDSKGGGPIASDTNGDASEADPQGGCGRASRYPGGGAGGGGVSLDGGYAGDDFDGAGVGESVFGDIVIFGFQRFGEGNAWNWVFAFLSQSPTGGNPGGGGGQTYNPTNQDDPEACAKMAGFADRVAATFSDPVRFAQTFADAIVGVGGDVGTNANKVLTMFGNSNYSPRPFGVGPALNGNALHDIAALAHSGAFKPQFRDSLNPNEDQSHHFAAYLELSTMTGKTAAEIYAWYSDGRHNQGPNKDQDNQGDVRLGDAAAEIGGMLHDKTLKPSEVGDWIRENICNP